MLSRRSFLRNLGLGLGAIVAAPAIVRAASIMPVKIVPPPLPAGLPIDVEWSRDGLLWRPYTAELAEKIRASGRTLFVDLPPGSGIVRLTSQANRERVVTRLDPGSGQGVVWADWAKPRE